MSFHFKWDQVTESVVDGKGAITLLRYKTLEDLLVEHYQTSLEDLQQSEHGGYDGDGNCGRFSI